jgi:hypothetical protein
VSDAEIFQLVVLVAVCLAAAMVYVRRARKEGKPHVGDPQKPLPRPEVVQRIKERTHERAKLLPPIPIPPPKPKEQSARVKQLKQNLLTKVLHNDATAARLLQFEIDELKRKGLPPEPIESMLERTIERWERDNA